jgi:hypothetical protein
VSLNRGLATVKLKPGNTVAVPQLWRILHEKGYTPKATTVVVKGEAASSQGRQQLKVSGTKDILELVPDPKSPGAFGEVSHKFGQTVVIQGVMTPAKNLKAATPLQVSQVR